MNICKMSTYYKIVEANEIFIKFGNLIWKLWKKSTRFFELSFVFSFWVGGKRDAMQFQNSKAVPSWESYSMFWNWNGKIFIN